MIDLIYTILITCAVTFGVYAAFRYEYNLIDNRIENAQIFGVIACHLDGFLPEIIRKPIYGCPPCMATVWTPIVWFVFLGLPFDLMVFAAWLGVAGINWLIVKNLEV